ncbi:MAG: hypothetical protein ACE5OY_04715 [Candidatus Bathyarchaeia archaeon]
MGEAIKATLRGNRVTIPLKTGESLRQKGYGVRRRRRLVLEPPEAFYLVNKGTLEIFDGCGERIPSSELFDRFRRRDGRLFTRYVIYRDLRERGYLVGRGVGRTTDFTVSGRGGADLYIVGINEGEPVPIARVSRVMAMAEGRDKSVVVAIVNRQGEVVYYSLGGWFPRSVP